MTVIGDGPVVGEAGVVAKVADGAGVAGYVDERVVKENGVKAKMVVGCVEVVGGEGVDGLEEMVARGAAFAGRRLRRCL